MRYLWPFAVVVITLGCTEIVPGTCYQNPAGGAGGAGSMPIGDVGASASGDYADPPRQPQDNPYGPYPPPECEIVSDTPCNEKCLSDYKDAAEACGKIEGASQRRTCQDEAHARYESCRASCQTANKTCTDMYVACQDKGMPCRRQIDKKKTLCEFCRDDCQNERPYKYSECYKCGFE